MTFREPRATATTRPVRASCNMLRGIVFYPIEGIARTLGKQFFRSSRKVRVLTLLVIALKTKRSARTSVRVRIETVKYGTDIHALVVDRWFYRGIVIQRCYDTRQVFSASYSDGVYSPLSPWQTTGRYLPPTFWQRVLMSFRCEVYRPYVLPKSKHPLVIRIGKLPCPRQRLEFFRRFEATGAFERM